MHQILSRRTARPGGTDRPTGLRWVLARWARFRTDDAVARGVKLAAPVRTAV